MIKALFLEMRRLIVFECFEWSFRFVLKILQCPNVDVHNFYN